MTGHLVVKGTGTEVAEYATIAATVIRCGCDDPLSHAEANRPCPTPLAVEDRGIVAEYHRRPGPLGRLASKLKGGQ